MANPKEYTERKSGKLLRGTKYIGKHVSLDHAKKIGFKYEKSDEDNCSLVYVYKVDNEILKSRTYSEYVVQVSVRKGHIIIVNKYGCQHIGDGRKQYTPLTQFPSYILWENAKMLHLLLNERSASSIYCDWGDLYEEKSETIGGSLILLKSLENYQTAVELDASNEEAWVKWKHVLDMYKYGMKEEEIVRIEKSMEMYQKLKAELE